MIKIIPFVFGVLFHGISPSEVIQIDLKNTEDFQDLPRFWTSTGFCPPAPINASSAFLLSPSVRQNLELVASVPNAGITHIRTHWILELIDEESSGNDVKFSFRKLDKFVEFLQRIHLIPHVEFMGNPGRIFSNKSAKERKFLWRDLTFKMLKHLIVKFGQDFVTSFRFETWNEPDLLNYNLLNFSLPDFIDYVTSIREGMNEIRKISPEIDLKLRGPAGLFHQREVHKLCYGFLEYCTSNSCPIGIFTFHRKGSGKAREILTGGIELLRNLTREFPWIAHMEVSNNEADPSSGWSRPLRSNSDVKYAAELVKTVLIHWDAKMRGILENLETISHDNAFLSYHPYEFNQRTLLAHFRMNKSTPIYSEFVKKPVLGALGLLANLASSSGSIQERNDVMFIPTMGQETPELPFYGCIVFVSTAIGTQSVRITVKLPPGRKLVAFGEIFDQKKTNPGRLWRENSSPSYPDAKLLIKMRKVQTPAVVIQSRLMDVPEFTENLTVSAPFVLSLRFCENSTGNLPRRVENVGRCAKKYQVFFKATGRKLRKRKWAEITHAWHIPDCSFDFWRSSGVSGAYKVRSVDILGRHGDWSKTVLLY
uniref:Putative alpha-l-iduronidase corethrella appendiculata n=1 Tax=Lutzomyia longipalpis TaxID=7200 RepID=A0A1B0CL83_LUTLO